MKKLLGEIFIPGEPRVKARPRFRVFPGAGKKSSVSTYTPEDTRIAERAVAEAWKALGVEMDDDPAAGYAVECRFIYWNRRAKDLDNLAKAVLDGLNGVAYPDDKQIVSFSASKWRAREASRAGTLVRVYRAADVHACHVCGLVSDCEHGGEE